MELGRELLLGVALLVAFNLLLAFGSIGLLVRMGPAIDQILKENVYSVVAIEELLIEFVDAEDYPLSEVSRERIRAALSRAGANVTEAEERPVLRLLERNLDAAMTGDLRARRQVADAIRDLSEINRRAMHDADDKAQRLGTAGAWAAVFIGVASLIMSILIIVRMQRRFVSPLIELHAVLEGVQEGNALRRCGPIDAPREIVQVAASVNRLLDERIGPRA